MNLKESLNSKNIRRIFCIGMMNRKKEGSQSIINLMDLVWILG